jgi:hypothetical protein
MRRRQPPKTSTPARNRIIAAEWPKGTPVGEIYGMVRALNDIAIQAGKMGLKRPPLRSRPNCSPALGKAAPPPWI